MARLPKTLPPLVPSLVTSLPEVDKTHLEYGWHTGSSIENQVDLQLLRGGAPPPGWSQKCFPKSESLLLLAKRYLIQWVLYSRFLQM